MDFRRVPFRSPLSTYESQAESLLAAHRAADSKAIDLFHRRHPRFLDEEIKWRPKFIPDSEVRDAALTLDDARLVVARCYSFRDWTALESYVAAVQEDGPVFEYESAVEAVIDGDLPALEAALRRNPDLVRARSTRVCCFDPPVHRATLLHYVSANGVEGYREKTPPNAVEIARALLQTGAVPDALADMYGGRWTTLALLVSSGHPAEAKLQVPLTELLLDFGAAVNPPPDPKWGTPLDVALAFGMRDAADALVRRGARVDLPAAAGLGRFEDTARLLPGATPAHRHKALALATQHGHSEIVRLLLDAGEDPNRYNPEGNHAHATPLHHAVLTGDESLVQLLVGHGARLDIEDKIWHATPLGWAIHGGGKRQTEMQAFLRSLGAA